MKLPTFSFWLGSAAALIWLLAACAPDNKTSSPPPSYPAPGEAFPKPQPTLAKAPAPGKDLLREDADPFARALAQASSAAKIAQSAKSAAEWQAAIAKWTKAIALLKSVPKTDSNYNAARQKIPEYQRQLKFAQQQVAKR